MNSKELFLSIEESNKEDIEMCRQLELLKEDGRIESKVEDIKTIANKLNKSFIEALLVQ